ncbi:MAG: hypothetical protein AAGI13_09310, partial [Pseudomonadota bacterium]
RIDLVDGASVVVEDLFGDAQSGGFAVGAVVGRAYDSQHPASGYLSIGPGAQLSLLAEAVYTPGIGSIGAYDTLNVGIGAGGTGHVQITGQNALLSASGTGALLRLGAFGGQAVLAVAEGGQAGTFLLEAGRGLTGATEATGRVTVDGIGSRLTVGGGFGAYAALAQASLAGGASFGLSSDDPAVQGAARGYFDISNGGVFEVLNMEDSSGGPRLRLGMHYQSYGGGTVTGTGTRLSVVQTGAEVIANTGPTVLIGEGGEGQLQIADGAEMEVLGSHALLAIAMAPEGQPVTAKESRLTIASGGVITLDAVQSANGAVAVGHGSDSTGRLVVTGADSLLRLQNTAGDPPTSQVTTVLTLDIGRGGSGAVEVIDSGAIEIDGGSYGLPGLTIGAEGGTGSLLLDGTDLRLSSSATTLQTPRIVVGDGTGSGSLTLRSGARLEHLAPAGLTIIAADPGSSGTVDISGAGTVFNGGTRVFVGAGLDETGALLPTGGDGSLTIGADAQILAEEVAVGSAGRLVLDQTLFSAELTLHGTLALSPGVVAETEIAGRAEIATGAVFELDVTGFEAGQADLLQFQTLEAEDLTQIAVGLITSEDARFFPGDRLVFATSETPLTVTSTQSTDTVSGRAILIETGGAELTLTALQGVALSLRSDGTIEDVTLPAARSFLAEIPQATGFEGRDLPVLEAGAADIPVDPGGYLL